MKVGSNVGTLKLGSTAVAAIKRGTDRVYDADVAAFQKASGATQVGPILALVDYLKAQSLWDYARFYPMKSAQNAGSGSTVYGLGGLTSNNMTLVNSPTWGSDGVTFNGSTQYGDVGDLWSGDDFAFLSRLSFTQAAPSAQIGILGNFNSSTDNARILYTLYGNEAGDPHAVVVSSAGTSASSYGEKATNSTHTTDEQTIGFSVSSTAEIEMYQEKSVLLQSTFVGSPVASLFDNSQSIFFAANSLGSGTFNVPTALSGAATFFLSGASLTTTQREAITDLINAL